MSNAIRAGSGRTCKHDWNTFNATPRWVKEIIWNAVGSLENIEAKHEVATGELTNEPRN